MRHDSDQHSLLQQSAAADLTLVLQFENKEPERARFILDKARTSDNSSTQRVWMKSAIVERELGNAASERKILEEGLAKFPYFDKLWLMLGQLEERQNKPDAARQVGILLSCNSQRFCVTWHDCMLPCRCKVALAPGTTAHSLAGAIQPVQSWCLATMHVPA